MATVITNQSYHKRKNKSNFRKEVVNMKTKLMPEVKAYAQCDCCKKNVKKHNTEVSYIL